MCGNSAPFFNEEYFFAVLIITDVLDTGVIQVKAIQRAHLNTTVVLAVVVVFNPLMGELIKLIDAGVILMKG